MKISAVLILFVLVACKEKQPPAGDSFFVSCICYKDSVAANYPLGNKFAPYDSGKVISYYQDSCNALKSKNGSDSCKVAVISL